MHIPEHFSNAEPADLMTDRCFVVLQHFQLKDIQHLGKDDLLMAQELAGHGNLWGRWQTPKSLAPSTMHSKLRDIDFGRRLRSYLKENFPTDIPIDRWVDEGVLALTRLALILRLAPSGRHGYQQNASLKPSSISTYLYTTWPCITARAIQRKAERSASADLFRHLTDEDIREFDSTKSTRIELNRLEMFATNGLWNDSRPLPNIRQTTDPTKAPPAYLVEKKAAEFTPFPEDWLSEIGPRVLWVVKDMGPNLLQLLEALPQTLCDFDWTLTKGAIGRRIERHILNHLDRYAWVDRNGDPLRLSFPLSTSSGKQGANVREWPPRSWEHIVILSTTLQAAHLFITLLATAARIGEIASLSRDCVSMERDSKAYLNGFTYKLSNSLLGEARQWPAPEILSQSLGQQARLADAIGRLPNSIEDGLPLTPRFEGLLWVSIGGNRTLTEDSELNFNQTLATFVKRLNMNTQPGGRNIHTHRFRKTIARIAGIALFSSPLVLKQLFGHKSIEMTLHYILCDPSIREETEKVLRELRIMHCAEALEEIHEAMRTGTPLPDHGGPGAARLITAVRNEDIKLTKSGHLWTDGSAYDLALLLTMQGQGWRLIRSNIVCSKTPGENGLCQKTHSKGEPNTANCQPQCENRIVFARMRRDIEQSIEQYLDIARQARDDGQLLVLAATLENMQDAWANFPDLLARYQADPEVQALFALCEEPESVPEVA